MSTVLKITVVGDGVIGKTCLLITYIKNEFPQGYIPTVFDNHPCDLIVDDKSYDLTLWDTAGQEEYHKLRILSYPTTNCFLLCYSIANRLSFENVANQWKPEIRHFCPNVPIVLVGTKTDLRIPDNEMFVTTAEGKQLSVKIQATGFVECSAKKKMNLDLVFETAVRAILKSRNSFKCQIL